MGIFWLGEERSTSEPQYTFSVALRPRERVHKISMRFLHPNHRAELRGEKLSYPWENHAIRGICRPRHPRASPQTLRPLSGADSRPHLTPCFEAKVEEHMKPTPYAHNLALVPPIHDQYDCCFTRPVMRRRQRYNHLSEGGVNLRKKPGMIGCVELLLPLTAVRWFHAWKVKSMRCPW